MNTAIHCFHRTLLLDQAWTDRWTDGWMDGQMDGQTDRCLDRLTERQADRQTGWRADSQKDMGVPAHLVRREVGF